MVRTRLTALAAAVLCLVHVAPALALAGSRAHAHGLRAELPGSAPSALRRSSDAILVAQAAQAEDKQWRRPGRGRSGEVGVVSSEVHSRKFALPWMPGPPRVRSRGRHGGQTVRACVRTRARAWRAAAPRPPTARTASRPPNLACILAPSACLCSRIRLDTLFRTPARVVGGVFCGRA